MIEGWERQEKGYEAIYKGIPEEKEDLIDIIIVVYHFIVEGKRGIWYHNVDNGSIFWTHIDAGKPEYRYTDIYLSVPLYKIIQLKELCAERVYRW